MLLSALLLFLNCNGAFLLEANSEDFTTASNDWESLPDCTGGELSSPPEVILPNSAGSGGSTISSHSQPENPCKCLMLNGQDRPSCKPNRCKSNEFEITYNVCDIQGDLEGGNHRCDLVEKKLTYNTNQIVCKLNDAGTGCEQHKPELGGGNTLFSAKSCTPCKTLVRYESSEKTTYRAGCTADAEAIDYDVSGSATEDLKCTFQEGRDGYQRNHKNDCKLVGDQCKGECSFKFLTAASECEEGEDIKGECLDPSVMSRMDQESFSHCG